MASDQITLSEALSMAIGGMVGGGIFAVLGVVAVEAGTATWIAFVASGVVAICAGYSALRLNARSEGQLNPIAYIEQFTGSTTLAGMTGWTFITGYVGTMSLYAYSFGGYFTELIGADAVAGLPLQPVITLLVIVVFVGLNLGGAHASGRTENILVGLKVLILLVFGFGGLYYGFQRGLISSGLEDLQVSTLLAASIGFVAFEGWELLLFDQENIENPQETITKAIYGSIVFVTALYVIVAVVTTNLVSTEVIQRNAETALAVAAEPFLGQFGFVLISIAALFSTGSALNATLFSASRLTRMLVADDLLPSQLRGVDDDPTRPLLVLGVLTALLSGLGGLDGISSFASLSFITIFGGFSLLAFLERTSFVSALIPAIGCLGAIATIVGLLYNLVTTEPEVFVAVVGISIAAVAMELLYFDREPILAEARNVKQRL
ncbi:APC family permease [Halococcus salifodinae]|uniref:Cationic amino acid transporter, putative n=1 Tax=Halococcus salifodinae DSM 8989 TaxID=1227456 RepID=M0N1S8_9EURY|nr:APC family permease [Halococcus salifodinae]EMA50650.1 cationic amino acid transporter, putative [Halococcus salifodinae DSM 8989]